MQMTYGTWHLEDPSDAVELDISQAKFHTGLYVENCLIILSMIAVVPFYVDDVREMASREPQRRCRTRPVPCQIPH
jgi:hypothetical protein